MFRSPHTRHWMTLGLLFLLMLLSATGMLHKGLYGVGLRALAEQNDRYLDRSFDKSLVVFGVLTGFKAGLAVIEGSQVGVGMGIEIGDVVQAVYDVVNTAWYTVLGGMVILFGTRYLLQACELVAPWFFTFALSFLFLEYLLRWKIPKVTLLRSMLRELTWIGFFCTLMVYLGLPLSIAGGRLLSKKITQPSIEEAEKGITQVKKDFDECVQEKKSGFWNPLETLRFQWERIKALISQTGKKLTVWILKLIAGYVFDCIVFPFLFFIAFFGFFRWWIRSIFVIPKRI